MHRDSEVIRQILTEIDKREDSKPQALDIDGIETEVLLRHLELLYNDGMLECNPEPKYTAQGGPYGHLPALFLIRDMTPAGHDLFSVMKHDGVWGKIKASFSPSELATLPLVVIKTIGLDLLEEWAKQRVGLGH